MTRKRRKDSSCKETNNSSKKVKTNQYESLPRQAEWKEENKDEGLFRYRLPIKTKTGWIAQEPLPIEQSLDKEQDDNDQEITGHKVEEEEEDSGDEMPSEDDLNDLEKDGEEKQEVPQVRSTVQLLARRTNRINKKKHIVADYCSRVLEDPQANVHMLNKLYRYCIDRCSDVALTIRKLAMMSLVTVYKDIIPGYRIRDLTDAEKAVKVSKDVRQLRDFEQKLLKFYDKFITILEQTVRAGLNEKKKKKGTTDAFDVTLLDTGHPISATGLESLGLVALKCMCELGLSASHFNYREKIFPVLVDGLISNKATVATISCETISKIFQNDITGETSLEIVQLISKVTKARNYYTKPQVLQPLVHLNLQHVNSPVSQLGSSSSSSGKETSRLTAQHKKKMERQRLNRKQKRKENARLRLEKELKETEAEERIEKKEKLQTEIIKLVFLIYFRVLKHAQDSPLLGSVLEGLAKFAHLISIDYFADLMVVLHSLMERNVLSSQQTMQCIVTAFQILSGQGEALNIDPRQFYCQLYTHLIDLDHRTSNYNMTLMLNCLDKVVRQKRKISSDRMLGIVKRMATVSLQLSPSCVLGLMHSLRQFIQTYRVYSERLLDNEEDCSSGVFRPDVTDPEMSCASSTHLWELVTLRRHFDPHVTCYAEHLIKGAPSQGAGSLHPDFSRKNPVEIMESHDWQLVDPFVSISPYPSTSLNRKRKRKSTIKGNY